MNAMNYVDPPDIPEGMTCAQYRSDRTRPVRRRLLERTLRRRVVRRARRAEERAR